MQIDASPTLGVPDSSPLVAVDVARGVCRMLLRHDCTAIAEVPLSDGRRADLMAIDGHGNIVIVEIKVSRADLLGDAKWTDYLAHCDRFYWAVPSGFDLSPFEAEALLPGRAGLIVADRYDAAIVRDAAHVGLAAPTRRKCTLAFARRAARRVINLIDPDAEAVF
jgi:hypothetical protein